MPSGATTRRRSSGGSADSSGGDSSRRRRKHRNESRAARPSVMEWVASSAAPESAGLSRRVEVNGMPVSIVVPQLGESVAEGTVSKWLKAVGDRVRKEEPLVEIQTDKINVEIPSPAEGTLSKILVAEGTTVLVGTEIATLAGVEEPAMAGAPAAAKGVAASSAPSPPAASKAPASGAAPAA